MFVRSGGRGPVILLLHGAPSTPEEFQPLARALADRYRVVIPDLPGYGFSAAGAQRSLSAEREELVRALAELGIERLHAVIGYSLGAYRALDLSTRIVVERLGLVAGFGALPDEHRAQFRELAAGLRGQATFDDAMRALLLERVVSADWRARYPARHAELTRALEITTPAAFAAELDAAADAPSLLEHAATYGGRSLVRVGELDMTMPAPYSAALGAALRVPVSVVPGAGHALFVEDTAATCAAIMELVR